MKTFKSKVNISRVAFPILLGLITFAALSGAATAQERAGEEEGARQLCPPQAMRNGVCDPNPQPNKNKPGSPQIGQKKQPRYTRVAKQPTTVAHCNIRVQQTIALKVQATCAQAAATNSQKPDLQLLTSQRVGVTIWKLRPARPTYDGARILSHPESSKSAREYEGERLKGDPLLAYGEKVRLGIESPRDGFLYVLDRELYQDGSLSDAYLIFPTKRLRDGNNRIWANRPVEIPALSDDPVYFEAKKIGLDPEKVLVGDIISIAITDKQISSLGDFGRDIMKVSSSDMESLENLYAGRAEVFEFEQGVGSPYSTVESDAANKEGSRLLTHTDPVPQTFFLVEDKRNGGLLVSIALSYSAHDSAFINNKRPR
ncbi:MAG TPA: hypothetical protein VFI24_02840 [Pyrinomonadaceae bacterium]|nr:hypothetical protein [Pyrinomonadaceae bacterium]